MATWLHACGNPRCAAAESARSTGAAPAGRSGSTPVIDMHCHVLTPAVEALLASHPLKLAEAALQQEGMGAASVAHNQAVMLPHAGPRLTRMEQRLEDMQRIGVDVQVLSPSPTQYYYWAEPALAAEIVRLQNEHIAGLCAAHPGRIAGLGTVALQHPELACEQLETAVKTLGLRGVEISTSVNGRELSDPALRTFWQTAQALGALVFIHPFGTTLGQRTATHYLVNTIGQPLETAIALSHLMFHGVLDACPTLKILAAHGGGYLPGYIGRSDHAHAVRPEARADSAIRPSAHLRRIWFDSLVYDGLGLKHLIERVGASQVVIGTDYPFDMGHDQPRALVASVPDLSASDAAGILGGNAASLIGWR